MICEHCKKIINSRAIFCEYCGNKITENQKDTNTSDPKSVATEKILALKKAKRLLRIELTTIGIMFVLIICLSLFCMFIKFPRELEKEIKLREEATEAKKIELTFNVYDAITRKSLNGINIKIINYNNEEISSGISDENGKYTTTLPVKGEYTISFEKESHYNKVTTKEFSQKETEENIVMIPKLNDDSYCFLLTWATDDDLDLCLYDVETEELVSINHPHNETGDILYANDKDTLPFEALLVQNPDYVATRSVIVLDNSIEEENGAKKILSDTGACVAIYGTEENNEGLLDSFETTSNTKVPFWMPYCIKDGTYLRDGQVIESIPEWATIYKSK